MQKTLSVLIVGGGGREHALAWKCRQSSKVGKIYCAPGNPGMGPDVERVPLDVTAIDELVLFAQEKSVDITIVGPEVALLAGIVDAFEEAGLKAYGPNKEAAVLEGSKSAAKAFMDRWQIPTAACSVVETLTEAQAALEVMGAPVVVKADGLMGGKGVTVALTLQEAEAALATLYADNARQPVVLEEYMVGEEVSLLAFVNGKTVVPMAFAQDHKPAYDGDQGPNTGGMGAYSPVPQFGKELLQTALKTIVQPTADGMVAEGTPFRGVLYTGLMVTEDGPKVVEYNVRFGDPEAQVLLPRLKTDLIDILLASFAGTLSEVDLKWHEGAAATVVAASGGYPDTYATGHVISGDIVSEVSIHNGNGCCQSLVFHAGTTQKDGMFLTDGGRVLSVTGVSDTLEHALDAAYARLSCIDFTDMHYRTDIGWKAIQKAKKTAG